MNKILERHGARPRCRARATLVGALALALGAQAGAVSLNPDGQGQVLLFPYYTVNGGLVTVMSLTNHSDRVKAVKLRFREARNSREVTDLNLYLSPFDQWTGALIDNGDPHGPALLLSDDTSCVAPGQVPATGQAFVNYQYVGANGDGGPTGLDRTRDGHIEVIEMGVVGDAQGAEPVGLASAATHDPDLRDDAGRVLPSDCGKIRAAWQANGVWRLAPNSDDDVAPPTGGLSGAAAIVDVAQGIAYPYAATAIDHFFDRPDLAASPLHALPGSIVPTLDQAEDLIADAAGGTATALVLRGNTVHSLGFRAARYRAVSALLTRSELSGDFNTAPGMGASSEWLISFPTKAYHLANSGETRRPFLDAFDAEGSCETAALTVRTREAGTLPFDPWPSACEFFCLPDLRSEAPDLCDAVSVVTINQAAGLASAVLRVPTDRTVDMQFCTDRDTDTQTCPNGPDVHEGWLRIQLGNADVELDRPRSATASLVHFLVGEIVAADETRPLLAGLPALGLDLTRYVNAQIEPGVLANYSTLQPLNAERFAVPVLGIDEAGFPIPVPEDPNP